MKLKNFIHAHVCILRTQLALRDSTSCVASVGFIFIIWRCGLEFRMCGLPGFIIFFFSRCGLYCLCLALRASASYVKNLGLRQSCIALRASVSYVRSFGLHLVCLPLRAWIPCVGGLGRHVFSCALEGFSFIRWKLRTSLFLCELAGFKFES